MNYAEVRWCDFPAPDHRRPAVILTRQAALNRLSAVTVAPITTSVRTSPAFVPLSVEDGLYADCAVNCDQLTTMPAREIGPLITVLPNRKVVQIHRAIRYALSIE